MGNLITVGATADYSVVFGYGHDVSGSHNVVGGYNHTVNLGRQRNGVFGANHTIDGSYNLVGGDNCDVGGSNNLVIGEECDTLGISAEYNLLSGYKVKAENYCRYNLIVGYECHAYESGSFVEGRYTQGYLESARSYSSGRMNSANLCQKDETHLYYATTGNQTLQLRSEGSTSNDFTAPDYTIYGYFGRVQGVVVSSTGTPVAGDVIDIELKGTLKHTTAFASLREIENEIFKSSSLTECSASIYFSGDYFGVEVTGQTDTNMDWHANISFYPLGYET